MSAAQIFYAVRASAPDANPFAAIAYTLYQSLYSPMSDFYMQSITALHVLYAVQAVVLIAALSIRFRRNRGDMWIFRRTSTSRGSFITPHFAVAWQVSSLFFLIVLQPYLVMTTAHANGDDWPFYLGARNVGFLPAWLSTWLALWSLTVAVCLPRVTGRRPSRIGAFLTSPRNVNIHFIGCIILCTVSIIIPSVYADHYYNGGILKFREAYAQLNSYVAAYPTMTSAEVDAALAPIVPVVQGMLTSLSTFPQYFKVSWALWFIWIMYSYGIFVAVAVIYFGYIRRGMKKIAGMDAKIQERNTLHRAWLFSALTSVMVTITGVLYAGTSFYLTAFTVQSLNSKFALEFETLSSLYGFAVLGLLAALMSLAQAILGSHHVSTNSSSFDPSHSTKMPNSTLVNVHVQTRTEVDTERRGENVVQLELADWKRAEEEKVRFAGDI